MGKRNVCRQDTLTLSLTTLLQGATISTFIISFWKSNAISSSHSLPGAVEKVLFCTNSNAMRRIIIQPTCRGRPVCLPLSAVLHSRNRLRRMVLVSINRVNECINRASQRVTGGHASPPLHCMKYFFNSPTTQPPRQAPPATPPKERNVPPLMFVDTFSTTPSADYLDGESYIPCNCTD